jgi:Fic family protein
MDMISDLYAFPSERIAQSDALTAQLIMAHRRLAELKGVAPLLPNQDILLNTLALQEAKDSSAVENIITSHDELFKQELDIPQFNNAAAKEVGRYSEALKLGFTRIIAKGKFTALVSEQVRQAAELGVDGVPTYILNDRFAIVGAQPYEVFEQAILQLANEIDKP